MVQRENTSERHEDWARVQAGMTVLNKTKSLKKRQPQKVYAAAIDYAVTQGTQIQPLSWSEKKLSPFLRQQLLA